MGNRLTETAPNGDVIRYRYNENNQLIRTEYPDYVTHTYEYNARGQLIELRDQADNLTSYRWNTRGQMTGMTLPTGSQAEYVYDETGHRTQQTVNGVETNYLWDEFSQYGDVVLETESVTGDSTHYTLVNNRVLSQHENGVTSYLLGDAQNTTIALTDSAGNVTGQYEYDAFGELLDTSDTPDTNYLYTGQQYDPVSDLYSLRARYYNPVQGRFLSRDAYPYQYQNPVELNRYVYTANNPVNHTDPSGNSLTATAIRTIKAATFFGSPGPGRIGGALIGSMLGYAVSAITTGLCLELAASGACGPAAAARSNPGLMVSLSGAMGAVLGAVTGYFAPELMSLGAANLAQLAARSAMLAIGVSAVELFMSGGDSLVCFLFDVALAVFGGFFGSLGGGNITGAVGLLL